MSDDEIKKGTDEEYYNRHQRSPGGNRPECQTPRGGWSATAAACNTLKQCARKDGLKWTDRNGNCPKGTVTVYLYINPSTGDYHWYRQREDGKCVHKPGGTKERGDDHSGHPIGDPDKADRGGYTFPCGKMCVPRGHIDLDKKRRAPIR